MGKIKESLRDIAKSYVEEVMYARLFRGDTSLAIEWAKTGLYPSLAYKYYQMRAKPSDYKEAEKRFAEEFERWRECLRQCLNNDEQIYILIQWCKKVGISLPDLFWAINNNIITSSCNWQVCIGYGYVYELIPNWGKYPHIAVRGDGKTFALFQEKGDQGSGVYRIWEEAPRLDNKIGQFRYDYNVETNYEKEYNKINGPDGPKEEL